MRSVKQASKSPVSGFLMDCIPFPPALPPPSLLVSAQVANAGLSRGYPHDSGEGGLAFFTGYPALRYFTLEAPQGSEVPPCIYSAFVGDCSEVANK